MNVFQYQIFEIPFGKGPSISYVSTLGYLVGQQNANLVNRPYLVNMLTRVLTWSEMGKMC